MDKANGIVSSEHKINPKKLHNKTIRSMKKRCVSCEVCQEGDGRGRGRPTRVVARLGAWRVDARSVGTGRVEAGNVGAGREG